MQIRQATPTDIPLLANLNLQLIRDEGHRNPMSLDELAVRMDGWLAGEYTAHLFEANDDVIGYVLTRDEPDSLYIRQFFICPEFRRQGLGRDAFEWMVANVWGASRRLRLDVLCSNASGLAFWRAIGFADYCLTLEREGASRDPNGS